MREWVKYIRVMLRSPVFWNRFSILMFVLSVALTLRHATAASASAAAEIFRAAASLAWPGIAFYFIFQFRGPIASLIARTKKASPTGVEFGDALAKQIEIGPIADTLAKVDPMAAGNPITVHRSTTLRKMLDEMEPDPTKQDRREALLISSLARSHSITHYLRVHMSIFGSQAEALERAQGPTEWLDLRPFYEAHVERFRSRSAADQDPTPPLDLAEWAKFFANTGLMEIQEERGRLTDEGRDYLDFMKTQNLSRTYPF